MEQIKSEFLRRALYPRFKTTIIRENASKVYGTSALYFGIPTYLFKTRNDQFPTISAADLVPMVVWRYSVLKSSPFLKSP